MIHWTDAPNGSAGHIGEALIVQIRRLAIGGWSAGWRNGMKWDVSDQTTQIAEQSSRHFRSLAAAKGAVRDHLLASGVIVAEERATPPVLGRWREVNVLLQEAAKVTWTAPGRTGIRTWIGCVSGHPVATIKRQRPRWFSMYRMDRRMGLDRSGGGQSVASDRQRCPWFRIGARGKEGYQRCY